MNLLKPILSSPLPTYIFFTYCNHNFPFNEGQHCIYKMFIWILKKFCTRRVQVNTHIHQARKVESVNSVAKLRNTNTNKRLIPTLESPMFHNHHEWSPNGLNKRTYLDDNIVAPAKLACSSVSHYLTDNKHGNEHLL